MISLGGESVILDPSLVRISGTYPQMIMAGSELGAWVNDKRTHLGRTTFDWLVENLATQVSSLPEPVQRSCRTLYLSLLGRTPVGDFSRIFDSDPDYSGPQKELFLGDLSALVDCSDASILGSQEANWPLGTTAVQTLPASNLVLTLHLTPGLPTPEERLTKLRGLFAGRRLIIVGGQEDRRVLAKIENAFGLRGNDAKWFSSEKDQRPRDLNLVVRGAAQSNAVIVCVTGKIGHAESGLLKEQCSKKKVTYIEVQSVGGIVSALSTSL